MSRVKTKINRDAVKEFLEKKLFDSISNLVALKGGEISQAYSFEAKKQSYIAKIRKVRKRQVNQDPFQKELPASEYITSRDSTIPIPKIIQKGIYLEEGGGDKYLYCISEKAEGSFVHITPLEKQATVDDALIKMLNKIHCIDISNTSNYGHWKNFEKADFRTWKQFILNELKKEKHALKAAPELGRDALGVVHEAIKRVEELLPYGSEKRYLVHGDYGYDNTLADESGSITAVFDWELSFFGDFVYDIAWLDVWKFRPEGTYAKLYRARNREDNLDYRHFNERVLCYKLYIGITAASFFIESRQKKKTSRSKKSD